MNFLVIQKWHKKIGVYVAIFVIFLAISGIALNHTEKFKLNTTYVKLDWLLDIWHQKIHTKLPWAELHVFSNILSKFIEGKNISEGYDAIIKKIEDKFPSDIFLVLFSVFSIQEKFGIAKMRRDKKLKLKFLID